MLIKMQQFFTLTDLLCFGRLVHKRPEDASQRKYLARVDRFVDYSRNQFLQESAVADPARDEVIQPRTRKPILGDPVTQEFRLQFVFDAMWKLA